MKHLEGKTVFLRPTGNLERRGTGQILEAKLVKVARVNVTIRFGNGRIEKLRFIGKDSMELDNGNNGGYAVYPDRETIIDMLFIKKAACKIHAAYCYRHNYQALDRDTIIKVAELLGVDIK